MFKQPALLVDPPGECGPAPEIVEVESLSGNSSNGLESPEKDPLNMMASQPYSFEIAKGKGGPSFNGKLTKGAAKS